MKLSQSAIGGYSIAANNCSDTLKFVPTAGQMSGSTNAAGGVLTELSGEYADNGIVSLSRNGVDRKYFSVDDSSATPLAELPDAPAAIQVAGDYNLLAPADDFSIGAYVPASWSNDSYSVKNSPVDFYFSGSVDAPESVTDDYLSVNGAAAPVSEFTIDGTERAFIGGYGNLTWSDFSSGYSGYYYKNDIIVDAEKCSATSHDDMMCWAAAASNIISYTGWGLYGADDPDSIFSVFMDNFTLGHLYGGNSYYAINWFFTGKYTPAGWSEWDQAVEGSGGFYKNTFNNISVSSCLVSVSCTAANLTTARERLKNNYGVGVNFGYYNSKNQRTGGHQITLWGMTYDSSLSVTDPNYYTGIIVSDSDDNKSIKDPLQAPNVLKIISITYNAALGRYVLAPDYAGSNCQLENLVILAPNVNGYTQDAETYTQVKIYSSGFLISQSSETDSQIIASGGNNSMHVGIGGTATRTTVKNGGLVKVMDGGTVNQTAVSSGGTLNISGGGAANSTTVNAYGTMNVSGGTVKAAVLSGTSAVMNVYPGGTVSGVTVDYKAALRHSGGEINDVVLSGSHAAFHIYSGAAADTATAYEGQIYVSSGGQIRKAVLTRNADMTVSSGGSAVSTTVSSGAQLTVGTGGKVSQTGVGSYGLFTVSGGEARNTKIQSAGVMIIDSGEANETIISSGGSQTVGSDGSAIKTTVSSGGTLHVSGTASMPAVYGSTFVHSGGTVSNAGIYSRGYLAVSAGGTACMATIYNGGTMNVYGGGLRKAMVTNGGSLNLAYQASAGDIDVYASGKVIFDRTAEINNLTVHAGGMLKAFSFADTVTFASISSNAAAVDGKFKITNNAMLISGGCAISGVSAGSGGTVYVVGGSAGNMALYNYGKMYVSKGRADNTEVRALGSMYITGGSGSNTFVDSQGMLYVQSGQVEATEIFSSGYMRILQGGKAVDTVNNGGLLRVSRGGSAVSSLIDSAGAMHISSGGSAVNTVLGSGSMFVSRSGEMRDTVLNDGIMHILSGGIHRGTLQIGSNAVVSAYTGAAIEMDISQRTQNDGYIINDLAVVLGDPDFSLCINSTQAAGTYKLAQGAENFTGSITVKTVDSGETLGSLSIAENTFQHNAQIYTLTQDSGDLLFTVREALCDLTVTAFKCADRVAANKDLTLNFSIRNLGEIAAAASTIWVMCNNRKIGEINIDELEVGKAYHGSYTIAGNTLTAGRQQIILFADGTEQLAETLENNNALGQWIDVTDAVYADLSVTTFRSASSFAANLDYTINYTVKNSGSDTAQASKLYITCDDVKIGEIAIDEIAVGSSYSGSYTIAGGMLAAGSKRFRLVADGAGLVTESNENNNGYSRTITVLEAVDNDLAVTVFKSAPSVAANQDYLITFAVQNSGSDAAQASKLYITDNGVKIGETAVGAIAAGGTYNGTFTIKGGSLSAGSHRLRLVADGGSVVPEINENNNGYSRTITVTQAVDNDLEVIGFGASATVVDSQAFLINFTVRNNGKDAADKSKLYITCDGVKVAEVNVGAIEGNGGLFRGSYTFAAGTLPIGAHKIRLVTDGGNTVTETNENNNGYTRTITISQAQDSDLTVAAFSAPASVAAGQTLTLNYTVRNSGTAPTGATRLYIYCDGVQIGETAVGAIAADGMIKGSCSVAGDMLKVGSHRIRIVADGYGLIPETNEDNNGYTRTVNVTAAPAEPLGIEMPMFEEVAADMPEFELPCCNDMDLAFEEVGTMSGTAPVDVSGSGSALFEAVTAVDTLTAGLYPATLPGDDGSKSKYAIELGIC